MAVIKILKEAELIGGTSNSQVLPVTHTQAVYDSNNISLEQRLDDIYTKKEVDTLIRSSGGNINEDTDKDDSPEVIIPTSSNGLEDIVEFPYPRVLALFYTSEDSVIRHLNEKSTIFKITVDSSRPVSGSGGKYIEPGTYIVKLIGVHEVIASQVWQGTYMAYTLSVDILTTDGDYYTHVIDYIEKPEENGGISSMINKYYNSQAQALSILDEEDLVKEYEKSLNNYLNKINK